MSIWPLLSSDDSASWTYRWESLGLLLEIDVSAPGNRESRNSL